MGARKRILVVATYLSLLACGGSGSSDSDSPGNSPPIITGNPGTSVLAGSTYDFAPQASDPDRQALTFAIANMPAWAMFDAATGRLSGTPEVADLGIYPGIAITVTDGALRASLPAFSIAVSQPQPGTATVSWIPPTQNEDGSALTNLKGYRIYYGLGSAGLNQVVEIPNSGATTALVGNLSPATWYFAVTAYSTSGAESALSEIKSKVIN